MLSQLARIPHKHLAVLTAGDVTVNDGVATIAAAGWTRTVEAVQDPVLCGPCAIALWLHTHDVIVTKIATRAVADHFRKATSLTSPSPHACRRPLALDDRSAGKPLRLRAAARQDFLARWAVIGTRDDACWPGPRPGVAR